VIAYQTGQDNYLALLNNNISAVAIAVVNSLETEM
jgi:hypothetical protein